MNANVNWIPVSAEEWKARVRFLVNRYAAVKGLRHAVCWSRLWTELSRNGLSVYHLARVQNGRAETPSAVVERLGKWEAAAKVAGAIFR